MGFEPRVREGERSGVCEGGEEGEGWMCEDGECGAARLYMGTVEVYQLRGGGGDNIGNFSCSNSTNETL